ncbi:hypothetical protein CTI12_AA551180 [Artemisia annua]|uniref:PPC domain-containing protein n=1 Tax=Artemisia annua TaxID=35608 RepID=A0A2U1KTF0_ARTAN|nr:hypothetical protein CTI12_AA551180 [Artemisia annua]
MQQPEQVMSPYVIEVSDGLDIVTSVTTLCNERDTGLCVLSGSGKVSNVSFKQGDGTSTPALHEDFLEKFVISIPAGPGGQILGGIVEGPLIASGTVYIIAASFNNPSYHRLTMEDKKEGEGNAKHSGGGGTNSGGDRVQYPHTGSGSVSEAYGHYHAGGGSYRQNYDAVQSSSAAMSLPMYIAATSPVMSYGHYHFIELKKNVDSFMEPPSHLLDLS